MPRRSIWGPVWPEPYRSPRPVNIQDRDAALRRAYDSTPCAECHVVRKTHDLVNATHPWKEPSER